MITPAMYHKAIVM